MVITVIGLGFVGLTTALGFADKGHKVFGLEANRKKLESLKELKVPFYEPMLQDKLKEHMNDHFMLSASIAEAVEKSDAIFICVGSPSGDEGKVDLTQIKNAIDGVLETISDDKFRVICIKSTVPPSTTRDDVVGYIQKSGFSVGEQIGVTNNPEFLREGYAWQDFIQPDRIVVGAADTKSSALLQEIYAPFCVPVHVVSLNTAEYIKYLSNTLLATMISFSNELSMIAHTLGDIDVPNAFRILHEDDRWNGIPAKMSSYVYPGCGFGGYCLPKDTSALIGKARDNGLDTPLLSSVLATNEYIVSHHVDRIVANLDMRQRIAILGLAFKPDSDDVRDTPSAKIINEILGKGYKNIVVYDPIAADQFKSSYSFEVCYAPSMKDAVEDADVVVICTAWKEFKDIHSKFPGKTVIDLRYST